MELVLVRHAEPEWVRDGLTIDDPPLTERGFEQAERLATRLAEERFDEVLVSPLLRSRQTAAPLLRRLGLPLRTEEWMHEIRSPVWQGTPAEKAEAAFKAERAKPSHHRWEGLPGGESVRDFVARIRRGASDFLAERSIVEARDDLPVWHIAAPGRRVLLVAHAGTNAVLICHLLGLQPVPWEWERFVLGHASISRVEALVVGDGHTFSLTRLSDVEHLDADQRTR
jgi:2,3-bisphosphoglycerate-dependent phosphoglycerate mutase